MESIVKKIVTNSFVGLFAILILSCSGQDQSTNSISQNQVLDVENYELLLDSDGSAQLIDVRTPEEFKEGSIKHAININFFDENFVEQFEKLDKDKTIYIYCASGGRSGKASKILQAKGFSHIIDLKGGYKAWVKNAK